MNDKCAAGTGRGLEVLADLIRVPIEDLGKASLNVEKEPAPVSNTCVIFAKAESVALLRQGWAKEKVAAAYHLAMVNRIIDLLTKVGIEKDQIILDLPPEGASLEEVEKGMIIAALERSGGNITRAARLLEVGRGTLRYKMKKYGIAYP